MKGHTIVEFGNGIRAVPDIYTFTVTTTKEIYKNKDEYLPIGSYRSYRLIERNGTFWVEILYDVEVYLVNALECNYEGNVS